MDGATRRHFRMYDFGAPAPVRPSARLRWRNRGLASVRPTVWFLGLTSLLTDVSSEMVTSVLPLYVVLHLGMTPLALGALDGLYQSAAAVVRTLSALVADRLGRHKTVAVVGYGASAIAKLGYLAAGTAWPALIGVIVADRLGKGIRTAPRDALIAQHSAPSQLATAFGVHRAMDAAGAALGPLAAFAILWLVPGRFDQVFLMSFAVALAGVAALLLLVDAPAAPDGPQPATRVSGSAAVRAVATQEFGGIAGAAWVLSAASVSDALLYLMLQRELAFDPAWLPLLYVGTPLCYFAMAGPLGMLADRTSTSGTFIAGHACLLLVYALLALAPAGPLLLVVALLLLGAYYAATDGVLAAMASAALPAHVRATGLSVLATGTTLARAGAAVAFGALWTYRGPDLALSVFSVALLCAIVAGGVLLTRAGQSRPFDNARGPT